VNGIATFVVILCAAALVVVPRRWGPLPVLIGTCYVPYYLGIQLGPFHLTAVRLLVAVGVIRIISKREWPAGGTNSLDRVLLVWAAWLLLTSVFHESRSSPLVYRLGLAYDALGIYVLFRSFCQSAEEIRGLARQAVIALVPLSFEMLYEHVTVHNLFSVFGGVGDTPIVREGRVRANGPFGHPILAGTVGAICLPLVTSLWKSHRKAALIGIAACLAIVILSASSGPILSALSGLFALYLWRYRARIHYFKWYAVAAYIGLDLIMKDPAYFIIARVDLAGGSTSWYRARLIQSAFEHLPEWWLAGTDYTRHWMWVVVSWSPNHTDITSHYIQMGIWGGLPLLLLFIWVLSRAFGGVANAARQLASSSSNDAFAVWTLGSSLFVIAVTGLSVSYFDQSVTYVFIILGAIGSISPAPVYAGSADSRKPDSSRNQHKERKAHLTNKRRA